jgi:cation transport protein ChaC
MNDSTDNAIRGFPISHEDGGIWVFGYGSLMWNPGFRVQERHVATLAGYHRALCVYSHFHRGTPEAPGLVLGLDRGGACRGVAFRVAGADVKETVEYLRTREQVTSVYLERQVTIRPDGHAPVKALTYVVDRAHGQYAGRLADEELLRLVRGARGHSGLNPDYVTATQAHLIELGVHDAVLTRLSAALA